MLKIWGRRNSINVQKVLWCADELGLAYENVEIGGAFGRNREPWYLALNPNGLVPTIEDGETVVWESNSIVRYLAARYGAGRLWPEDAAARSQADRWMDWQLSALGGMTTLFWGWVRTPPEKRDLAALETARQSTADVWRRLDGHLAGRGYVAGAAFGMGDIPVGAMCYRWQALPIERPELPNLAAWYARLSERPAYRRHVMVPMT
jgi:glutathione S-transferase